MKDNRFMDELIRIWKRIKDRYFFIILFTIVVIFFSLFYKGIKYKEISNNSNETKEMMLNSIIKESIKIDYNKPKEIAIKVGKNKPTESAIYKVNIISKGEVIVSQDIDTLQLKEEEMISIVLPQVDNLKGQELDVQIVSNNANKDNALIIYTFENGKYNMFRDGLESNKSLSIRVEYPRFTGIYIFALGLLYIAGVSLILLINVKKIHNSIFAIVVVIGTFSIILNPLLDTPDDHAHLARSELTSRGIFFVSGEIDKYHVSGSIKKILEQKGATLEDISLYNGDIVSEYTYTADNYANTNFFIGYIPQAVGIIIGKLLGSNIFIVILPKLLNLLVYAFVIRYAIKIAPIFKLPLSIVSIMPMAIFIASSYNPDATTYGLVFLAIGYLLSIYVKEKITYKEIAIYSILSIAIGLVKLPYCIIGGLIIFLPKNKFINNKTYYSSFLFVVGVAIVSMGWGVMAMLNSGNTTFNSYYVNNNIDTKKQVSYILSQPIRFVRNFCVILFNNIREYMVQLNTFGWFSYGLNIGAISIYEIFIGSIILIYPNEEVICKKTKSGVGIVALGIYVVTCFVLYLCWTPVGSSGLEGVQGRYFVPLIGLLTLLSSQKRKEDDIENLDFKYLIVALTFAVIFIITMMNKYY